MATNPYTIDTETASCEDLSKALDELASRWNKQQGLKNANSEEVAYNNIRDALKKRCNQSKKIEEADGVFTVV